MIRLPQSRRGVVILVVLSLLVLFVLLVVTFAIVAGQYRRAAQAVGRREWLGEDPLKTADRVMYALLREPDLNQTGSPLRGHALLTDVYGRSMRGRVSSNGFQLAGNQIVQFNFTPSWAPTISDTLSGFYNGSVLTFEDGPLQNVSTRVLGYAYTTPGTPPTPVYTMWIMSPLNDGTSTLVAQNGNSFVLNGKPFVGAGFGYNSAAGSPIPRSTDEALKPNRVGDNLATLLNWAGGGANESYDAADYQNLILAAVSFDVASNSTRVLPSFHRPDLVAHWIARDSSTWNVLGSPGAPATRVPAIISPTDNVYANLTVANRDFRRKIVFRPMPWDHPNFTGGNPDFDASARSAEQIDIALTRGSCDVDNDGDGTKDSIWIDPDLPIQTTEDGRVHRPLVAIHCVDLDGRLNVNAHGNYEHIPPRPWTSSTPFLDGTYCAPTTPYGFWFIVTVAGTSDTSEPVWPTSLGATVTDGTVTWRCVAAPIYQQLAGQTFDTTVTPAVNRPVRTSDLPKGQGYGPPEINLLPLIGFAFQSEYLALLQNRYGTEVDASTTPWKFYHFPGTRGFDKLAEFKFFEYPQNFRWPDLTSFFSNSDLRGQFAFGVDHFGQPLYESLNVDLLTDSPYEFSPGRPNGSDTPFTPAELERVLRHRDYDAGTLDSRLQNLLTALKNDPSARQCVTTDSYDIPVPAVVATDDYKTTTYATSVPIPQTIFDLLAARLIEGLVPPANVNSEIQKLLYSNADLRMGLKLDLNRPFGNGRDDDGNMIVDEPSESGSVEYVKSRGTPITNLMPLTPIDHDNDGVGLSADSDAYLARSFLARHLYVLAMLLKDKGFYFNFDGDNSNDAKETAKILAQWAINVVDFRDADSIMTPFEYDTDPFNGWQVDGDLGTAEATPDRDVVWGCERPELLMTEAFAFHDRRSEDLDSIEGGSVANTTDATNTFDQRLRPRGSLFVELYNPWTGSDRHPAEFYYNGAAWRDGVVLNKRVGGAAGSPVWRLVVSTDTSHDQPSNIERTVYFTDPKDLGDANLGNGTHYTTEPDLAPLVPGRYAVIGPTRYKPDGTKDYATTIGRRTDALEGGSLALDKTRQIVLGPDPSYAVNQVRVLNNSSPPGAPGDPIFFDEPFDRFTTPSPAPPSPPSPQDVQPAIAVPVDCVRLNDTATGWTQLSLSISEPLAGYPDPISGGGPWDPTLADDEGAYEPAGPQPLDEVAGSLVPVGNGTTSDFRRIHLQRLADPTRNYDPTTNPYLTIDVMPVGLTVFNGVTTSPADPSNPEAAIIASRTVQRGQSDAKAAPPYDRKLWPQEQSSGVVVAGVPETVHRFNCILDNSLGYLNAKYHPRFNPTAIPPPPAQYLGAPIATDPSTQGYPFPWLPWNNRPFVSPTELLLVPRSSPARLLFDFNIPENSSDTLYDNPAQWRFPQTLNLFLPGYYDAASSPAVRKEGASLYRLLEYVTVRSRFLATEMLLNPTVFANGLLPGTDLRHPPFNTVSDYREPGRINLNTVYDARVWNALWGPHDGFPASDPKHQPDHQQMSFADFIDNRRGYPPIAPATAGDIFATDPTVPTVFANPYRAPGTPLLVPPDASGGIGLARLEVDATLLRTNRSGLGTAAPSSSDTPRYLNDFTTTSADPLRGARNSDRNAYFSYQALQRLSNLVTCRSNVYAMWLTIGYFEVDPLTGQLGQEVGIDTGSTTRHRAFYIIDRSIPVAFEPGQNHNVDKCVLLRRFIE